MGKFLDSKRNVVCLFLGANHLSQERFEALAEACFRFSPWVAFRFPEAVFLNIQGCDSLFSELGLSLRLLSLGRRFFDSIPFQGRVIFAEDAATALALARYPLSSVKRGLPLEALSDYDAPFTGGDRKSKAQLFSKETLLVLHQLGLKNIGDFMDLPSQSLAARFGKLGVQMSARIRGEAEIPWPTWIPAEEISESAYLDEETQLEAVFFALRGMVDRTMARLKGLAQRASQVAIDFEVKKFSTVAHADLKRRWEIELPVAQGAAPALLSILRDRIYFDLNREPLVSAVERVCFQVLETVPGRGAQLDFFDKKEEEEEKWNGLVGRLAQHLGKGNVFIAQTVPRYLPENSWRKELNFNVFQEMSQKMSKELDASWNIGQRPLRVLKKPEPIRIENGFLIHPTGKRWKVLQIKGPERMTPEWWEASGSDSRDYYQVTVEKGQKFWIYYSSGVYLPNFYLSNCYLHGYFD